MQVPKKRISKSRRNMRRAHDALTPGRLSACTNCGEPVRSHHVCMACGYYRGRQLVSRSQSVE
jgi:large subunit ribosomal protein L32